MHIELSTEERDMLVRLIEREIHELGPEIRHTQTSSYRDKQALRKLLERLRD